MPDKQQGVSAYLSLFLEAHERFWAGGLVVRTSWTYLAPHFVQKYPFVKPLGFGRL